MENPTNNNDKKFNTKRFAKALGATRILLNDRQTVRDAAKEMGVSPATYCRLENGYNPDINTFFLACKWMGLEMSQFFGATDDAFLQFTSFERKSHTLKQAI